MAGGRVRAAIDQVHRLIGRRDGVALSDAQLLADFVTDRDEKGFEVLVWRHGAMVLSLCRRVLGDVHDAEDAFQATFLVFARKAASIGRGESVGGWLYKVAYRVALRARATTARRRGQEEPIDDLPGLTPDDEVVWRDLRPVLDEEIDRLPVKYRVPFVLCYLEGRTNEEAAEEIGCPKGTILSRLSRGREQLRSRLARRGLALSVGCLVTALSENAAAASVPTPLMGSTVGVAIPFSAGKASAGLVSGPVATLTQGVLHTMFLTKLKIYVAALVALTVLGTGAGLIAQQALAGQPATEPAAIPADEQRTPDDPDRRGGQRAEQRAPDASGKVVSVSKDGKSFTLEVPTRNRGEEPTRVEVKIGDKTALTYNSVGLNAARPTENYHAVVHMEDAAKGVAASVAFVGSESLRPTPDLVGTVAAVAKDGKGITLAQGGRSRRGEDDAKKTDVTFDARTVIIYSAVPAGGAKLTTGYAAQVYLADSKTGTAAIVRLHGNEASGVRGEPGPDMTGRVLATDGKTITVETRSGGRGEEPTKETVKIGDKTTIVYHDVGPDGTKIAEKLQVRIWLANGSKDTADRVLVTGVPPERWTTISGKVVAVSADGRTVTLEAAPATRTEEAKRIDVKLTIETRVSFSGVGPDEAKVSEGYFAHVRLVDGSKDTAAQVGFVKGGSRGERTR
jgi:RNA polymerase sigma factor (sigma-70 family)